MKVEISLSSTQKQRECAQLLFNTDYFLPKFRKLATMKGKGIDVDKVQQLLFFLENASDEDIFNFIDSNKTAETLGYIDVICGTATLDEFMRALTNMYVPLTYGGMQVEPSKDILLEAKAILQPLKNIKPANVSAAKPRTGKHEHPMAVKDVGHVEIPIYRRANNKLDPSNG